MIIQHRRGKIADWKKADEAAAKLTLEEALEKGLIPRDGELFIVEEEDGSCKYKIGDGKTVSSRLPYLDERAEKKLVDKLAAAKVSLSNRIDKLETTHADLITNNYEKLLTQIFTKNTELSTAFNAADQRVLSEATQLIDDSINELQQEFSNVTAEISTDLASLLNVEISQSKKELADKITVVNKELHEKADSFSAALNILKTELSEAKTTFVKDLEESVSNIVDQDEYAEAISTLSKTDDDLQTAVNDISKKLVDTAANIEKLVAKHAKDLLIVVDKIEVLEAKIATDSEASYLEISETINTKVENLNKSFTEQLSTLETSLVSLITDKIAGQTKALQEAKSFLSTQITNNKKAHENAIEALDSALKAKDATLLKDLNTLQKQYNLDIPELTAEISSLESKLNQSEENWLDNWNDLKVTIEDISSTLSADITEIAEQHSADNQELATEINTLAISQQEAAAMIMATLKDYMTNVYLEIDDLVEDDVLILEKAYAVENSLSRRITDVETYFNNALTAKETTLQKNITDATADFTTAISGASSALSDSITEVDRRLTTELATKATIESLNEAITQRIASINAVKRDLAAVELAFTTSIESTKQTLETELALMSSAINTNLETSKSNLNIKIAENQRAIIALDEAYKVADAELAEKISFANASITVNKRRADSAISSLEDQIQETREQLDDTNLNVYRQSRRIDKLIALPNDITEGNAELIDIRTGYNGIDHGSAGEAVRAIGQDLENLKATLPDYIPANSVDGLLYEDNLLYLTSDGVAISDPVEITGGGGGYGSISTVKITNNLPSATFTVAKGKPAVINFTYTSFENEVETGDGTYTISINNKKIDELSGVIQHNVAKSFDVTEYLKNGANTVKVVCSDQYGTTRSLTYHISTVELRLESSFDNTKCYDDSITFRYTAIGQVSKTVEIYLDDNLFYSKTLGANASGTETTVIIPKQSHGGHKILAYMTATIGTDDVTSNELRYEIICIEKDDIEFRPAILTSVMTKTEFTQGDLISIPYQVYDPRSTTATVSLKVYTRVGGVDIEMPEYGATATVERNLAYWSISQYPTGKVVFKISYTYTLLGDSRTIEREHVLDITELKVNVEPETDSLQLFLNSVNRSNDNLTTRDTWTFGDITTTFTDFNWQTNGWINDKIVGGIGVGDVCLRLNGEARAVINFKPFETDFTALGKTIELEFAIRDVNRRDTIVVDCLDADGIGLCVTPDTAFMQSSGPKIACNFKEDERVRVSITVEPEVSGTYFVSVYLDGVLSGIQKYKPKVDRFSQVNPVTITLGSSYCGIDIYSIRMYNKALTASQVLNNFIADKANPVTMLGLVTDNNILYTVDDAPSSDFVGKISYEKVQKLGQIPIITFTGTMPKSKGDKKKDQVKMTFEDPANPNLSFTDILLKEIDVQGTSSADYVRKNWKIKFHNNITHMPGAMPAKVYCIKVDYAEATGTHNTGTANFIEGLYDRTQAILPPQKDNEKVRTTIQGFPCIIFEKATPDSVPVFSSKGNFNYDKGAEDVFGFTKNYDSYGVECWEFCNNISDAVNFLGPIPADWSDDFEPRYVPESFNFDAIEELVEARNRAKVGNGVFTEAQQQELSSYQEYCIRNFKELHDWVLSTATYTVEGGVRKSIVPPNDAAAAELSNSEEFKLKTPVTYDRITHEYDTEAYRLAKFTNEFDNYFNRHYATMYYVFTSFALMVDQRAKNLFLTRWKDDTGRYRWYPYFYDNDTIFGINNVGILTFDYFHEDIDQIGTANVYNGQHSVLWNNFRLCFNTDIETLYRALRSDGKLTYEKLIDQYITKGSDKWSAAIYNADAEYKYVSLARPDPDTGAYDDNHLQRVRGPAEHHLRYFVSNRLNYFDSKWYAGDYRDDKVVLRVYTPVEAVIPEDATEEQRAIIEASNERIRLSQEAVKASSDITVTPYSNMYAGVQYASGTLQQKRVSPGQTYTFSLPGVQEANDTETAIYGASALSSLGDLSNLYCDYIDLSKAAKLIDLKVGHSNPNYRNDNIRKLSLGMNRLLKKLDIRNCSGLGVTGGDNVQKTLDIQGCQNIETILAEGTNIETISLPDGGYIETLRLPASIKTLIIKNQPKLTMSSDTTETIEGEEAIPKGFYMESYENLDTIQIENCSKIDTLGLLQECRIAPGKFSATHVRLKGFTWTLENVDFLKEMIPEFEGDTFVGGLLDTVEGTGTTKDAAHLEGICYVKNEISGEDYALITSHFPNLTIVFTTMTSYVTFKYQDAMGTIHTQIQPVYCTHGNAGECELPALEATPAWPENDAFTYEFVGWSTKAFVSNGIDDIEVDVDAEDYAYRDAVNGSSLKNILGNRTLHAIFKPVRKTYYAEFLNLTNKTNSFLAKVPVLYGSDAIYPYDQNLIKRGDVDASDLFEFTHWTTSNTDFETTSLKVVKDTEFYAQFALKGGAWHELELADITGPKGEAYYTLDGTRNTMEITKNINTYNAVIKIPSQLKINKLGYYTIVGLGSRLFEGIDLELMMLPDTITDIGARAFERCAKLFEINLPSSLRTIGQNAFNGCSKLKAIKIPAFVESIGKQPFGGCGALTNLTCDPANARYTMVNNCLIDTFERRLIRAQNSTTVGSPDIGVIPLDGSIDFLGEGCFSKTNITAVTIPDNITTIPLEAFSNCSWLEHVTLPEDLQNLDGTCFAWCTQLKTITLPEGLTTISSYAFDGCALKDVIIPSSVSYLGDHSFGSMEGLSTVTFKKAVDGQGNVIVPTIHEKAFERSGSTLNKITFNVPWSRSQADVLNAGWGARGYTINYDYDEDSTEEGA